MDWVAVASVLFVCAVLLGLSELTRVAAPGYSLVAFVAVPAVLVLLLATGLVVFVTK